MRHSNRITSSGNVSKALSVATLAVVLFATAACSSDSGTPSGGSATGGSDEDLSYETPKVDEDLRALLPDSMKDATSIVAGSSLANPPMNFTDPNGGDPTGYLVELANAAGAKLGLEVTWEKQPYPGLVPALQTKKIQFFSPGSPSPDALKVINVAGISQRSTTLNVPKGNPKKIEEFTDACGLTIAYTAGSIVDETDARSIATACVEAGETEPTIENYPAAADALTAVRSGRADGMILPDTVGVYNSDSTGLYDSVLLGDFPVTPQGLGFLKADGTELPEAFVAAVKALQEDGIYDKILKKYGLEEIATLDNPELITGE
jgi:polar amino acid transport system substrate-binding protein